MTEVNYYWHHHMMSEKDRKTIQQALDNHDFITFIKYYKIYNSKGIQQGRFYKDINCFCPVVYLPDEASYKNEKGDLEFIDILDRDNFNKITFSESECG